MTGAFGQLKENRQVLSDDQIHQILVLSSISHFGLPKQRRMPLRKLDLRSGRIALTGDISEPFSASRYYYFPLFLDNG
jgi:hypothetical protein